MTIYITNLSLAQLAKRCPHAPAAAMRLREGHNADGFYVDSGAWLAAVNSKPEIHHSPPPRPAPSKPTGGFPKTPLGAARAMLAKFSILRTPAAAAANQSTCMGCANRDVDCEGRLVACQACGCGSDKIERIITVQQGPWQFSELAAERLDAGTVKVPNCPRNLFAKLILKAGE